MNVLLRGDAIDLPARLESTPGWVNRPWDLVYLDPPFATGTHFTARLAPGQARGAKRASTTAGSVAYDDRFDDIDAFLDMLFARVAVFRDHLSSEGSLWLHLDQRTVHDAKVRCDRLFGRGAFRGEIVWSPGNGARGRGHSVPSTHQTLLIYTRDPKVNFRWNGADADLREPFADTSLSMHFTQTDADGRRYRERVVNGRAYRYYADEGRLRGSIWNDLPSMVANTPLRREGTGYPTQKPVTLLSRVIRAATRPGQLVVDPMCGSGTTLEAAAKLDRAFVGNDIGELAHKLANERLTAAGITFVAQP